MRTTSMAELLAQQRSFAGLPPDDLAWMAGCARNEIARPGEVLAREDDPARQFFLVREGLVASKIPAPGGPLVVDTAGPGDVVGWAWLFPPYRWTNDVEVVQPARLVRVESDCLRDKAQQDPAFGARVMDRFAQLMGRQLEATQMRLVDLYRRD